MEYQKISNLLNKNIGLQYKFMTRKMIKINDQISSAYTS